MASKLKSVIQKGKPVVKAVSKIAKNPAVKAGAKVAGVIGTVVTAASLIEKGAEKLGIRGGAGFIGKNPKKSGKRRRGRVPKTVKKWATRMVSRRKQEEKMIKDMFGSGGGKVIKSPKKSSTGSISRSEALSALRD